MKYKFFAVFALLWLSLIGYKIFNPATKDGEAFLTHLSTQKIDYIVLRPTGGSSPIGRTTEIRGQEQLERFITLWKGAGTFLANHPKDIWSIAVSFHTDKGVYEGTLRATSNQGVTFDFQKSPTGWPVASQYQLTASRYQVETALRSLR